MRVGRYSGYKALVKTYRDWRNGHLPCRATHTRPSDNDVVFIFHLAGEDTRKVKLLSPRALHKMNEAERKAKSRYTEMVPI